MVLRAVVTWFALMVVALLNAALRELIVAPLAGSMIGHVSSTMLLAVFILLLSWVSIPWIGPDRASRAFQVGIVWFILTQAFEWLAGHYIFGSSWQTIIDDYNVSRGRIWVIIPITTLLAPVLVHWRKSGIRGSAA